MSPVWPRILAAQDLADAEDLGERAARRGDRFGAAAPVVDEGPVDATDVRDQLARHCLAFDVDRAGGPDRGQQPGGPIGRELPWCAAGAQVAQQAVQPVDRATALGGQLVAAVREQPQHGAVVVRRDPREVIAVLGDDGDAARVDTVALAAVAALEHAGASGQRRGNVHHGLVRCDELLSQQPSQAAGALDRPDALRPGRGPCS
jgi:hypothetical protein